MRRRTAIKLKQSSKMIKYFIFCQMQSFRPWLCGLTDNKNHPSVRQSCSGGFYSQQLDLFLGALMGWSGSSPVVLPRSDPELGVALLAQVALAPLRLLAEEVEQTVEELLGRHVAVEDRDALKPDQINKNYTCKNSRSDLTSDLRVLPNQGVLNGQKLMNLWKAYKCQ